jgi:hypothetical protein
LGASTSKDIKGWPKTKTTKNSNKQQNKKINKTKQTRGLILGVSDRLFINTFMYHW